MPSRANAPAPRPRRRWLRRLGWTALAALLAVAGFVGWALLFCFATPPPLPQRPPLLDQRVTTDGQGRRHLGDSWFEPRPYASRGLFTGTPVELGFANASLCADLLAAQEQSLFDTVAAAIPSAPLRWGIAFAVLVNNRTLPDFVPEEYRYEILGLSFADAGPDPYTAYGSRYHRILNYHAAHDISHWVWDEPALGCTAFAARGPRTADGHLLVGRNFDWEAGEHFDRNKVVALFRPSQGHAFLSVVWPGMAGAVTGLNDARIFCSINGAHSSARGRIGRPVSLVVRQVLQYADSIAAAERIVREAPVFVSDSFLIADGRTGEAIVVEKTPANTAARGIADDLLLQANHFESPEFANDAGNLAYRREGSSEARRERLAELLTARTAPLDPAAVLTVLRDRAGPGGAPRSLGHRATLNADIATHAVVADVTAGILWVSTGPHQAGGFAPYSIEQFPGAPAAALPADPLLATGALERLAAQRAAVAAVQRAQRARGGPAADDVPALERALADNPGEPETLLLLATTLEQLGRKADAARRYAEAEAAVAPYRPQRDAAAAGRARTQGG